MKLSLTANKSHQRISLLFVGFYIVSLVLISFLFLYLHHRDQVRLARSYSFAAKDSIVALDLRQAIVSLNSALQDGFEAVAIRDQRGTLRAAIPRQSTVEEEIGAFDIKIEMPLYYSENIVDSEKVATLDFYYPIKNQIIVVLCFFLVLSIGFYVFFRRTLKKIEEQHINELKKQEADLVAKTTLQVLHDIQSPLTVLTLSSKALEHVPEPQRELIEGAVQRISEIAKDLLRKSSGLHKKENPLAAKSGAGTYDIAKTIEKITKEKIAEYSDKNIVFEASLPPSVILNTALSESSLSRVVSNLINNSVKAMPGGGTIKVVVHPYTKSVAVQIADSGEGMSEEFIAKLGKEQVTSGNGGNGLGLSHAFKVIEEAGARLDIFSRPGSGTIITIKLPRS